MNISPRWGGAWGSDDEAEDLGRERFEPPFSGELGRRQVGQGGDKCGDLLPVAYRYQVYHHAEHHKHANP